MVIHLRTLDQLLSQGSVKGKNILLRVDLNVPMKQGKVIDFTRINRVIPTIELLSEKHARVILLSHFGRPNGEYIPDMSLAPIADALSNAMNGREIKFGVDCTGISARNAVDNLQDGDILLLENVRFHSGEKQNDETFSQQLASLGEIFVNDAFSGSHRAHASITGIGKHLPAYAGLSLEKEVTHLEQALHDPKRPVAAIVGGAKISTKLNVLTSLVEKVDHLFVGGAMANTFLLAQGHAIGTSLHEADLVDTARNILEKAKHTGCAVHLPVDVITAATLTEHPPCHACSVEHVPGDSMILDVGADTIAKWITTLDECSTVIWNGPLGAFEYSPFDTATTTLIRKVARMTEEGRIQSIAGGGDILAALSHAGLRDSFSYISTAGGAFLEWLEGKSLPGIEVLAA